MINLPVDQIPVNISIFDKLHNILTENIFSSTWRITGTHVWSQIANNEC